MKQFATIGLDLAKQVFQVHAAAADGSPIFNRKLRRAEVLRFFEKTPACLVGMEACGSAHYWARELSALGHEVRLFNYLQALAAPSTDPVPAAADPAKSLRAYAAGVKRPGPLLILSDLMDDGWLDGLHALSGRGFEVSLVHILAPDEAEPQLEGDLKLLDSEGGAAIEITADYDLLARRDMPAHVAAILITTIPVFALGMAEGQFLMNVGTIRMPNEYTS